MIWSRYFREVQGYIVEDIYVYQDNQRAILLETNGMKSVGKKLRHIKINFFFITNRIKNNDLNVIYFPTKEMVAVFFTKPLQGILFITHQNTVLGFSEHNMSVYRAKYEKHVVTGSKTNTAWACGIGKSVLCGILWEKYYIMLFCRYVRTLPEKVSNINKFNSPYYNSLIYNDNGIFR